MYQWQNLRYALGESLDQPPAGTPVTADKIDFVRRNAGGFFTGVKKQIARQLRYMG